uniref:Ion transport domain-containing protein n=1 Tax=Palpitomonas bilix TaxID=652834 RepID=A0A7S3D7J9_9EUKA|mmetsp:Transcript_25805/g.65132  ORF Transcript_25805/g.65132 Transcript_25805/m.65132 type:complete len:1668 (+) Transcript_25805:247-5250(+)
MSDFTKVVPLDGPSQSNRPSYTCHSNRPSYSTSNPIELFHAKSVYKRIVAPPDWSQPKKSLSAKSKGKGGKDEKPGVFVRGRYLSGKSCLCLPARSPYRIGLAKFIFHKATEGTVLALILINTIFLAINDYNLEFYKRSGEEWASTLSNVVQVFDYIITCVFVIEIVILMLVQGVIMGKDSYFRDNWNRLDFLVVLLSVIDSVWGFVLIASPDDSSKPPTKMFAAFRAFRSLRPLRSFRFFEGTRAILESLRKSLGLLLNVLLFMLFFLILFGITGVELFGNSLNRRCVFEDQNDTMIAPPIYCKTDEKCSRHFCFNGMPDRYGVIGPRYNCSVDPDIIQQTMDLPLQDAPKVFCDQNYGNPHALWNFDNFATAAYTIFQTSTLDGWAPTIMLPLMDSELSAGIAYFFLLVFFLNYLVQNLFIAVVATTFARVREAQFEEKQKVRDALRQFQQFKTREVLTTRAKVARKGTMLKSIHFGRVTSCCSQRALDVCQKFRRFIEHPVVDGFLTAVIVLNCVFMALEFEGMPEVLVTINGVAEHVFTWIFFVEMVVKMVGYRGPVGYWRVPMNVFDFIIVVAALANYIDVFDSSLVMVLRLFRLARLSRLLRRSPAITKLLNSVFSSLRNIVNLFLFMALTLLVFSVLGMSLFGGRCCVPACPSQGSGSSPPPLAQPPVGGEGEGALQNGPGQECCNATLAECCSACPRWNFNSFGVAILTLFQVLTGDSWSTILLDTFDVGLGVSAGNSGEETAFGTLTIFYFVLFYIIAQFVVLNLYIAVILENFSFTDEEIAARKANVDSAKRVQQGMMSRRREKRITRAALLRWISKVPSIVRQKETIVRRLSQEEKVACPTRAREKLRQFVSNKWFERVMLVFILLSSAMFALEDYYLYSRPLLKQLLYIADAAFLGVFAVELLLRLLAYGFFAKGVGVFRTFWGWLDLIVLLATALGLVPGSQEFVRVVRVIRVIRILRPLRVINRFEKLKLIVNALISSMVSVVYVALLMFALFFMFAILGVNLFRGKLYFCNDGSVLNHQQCKGFALMSVSTAAPDGDSDSTIPFLMPRVWERYWWHFDHVGAALLALFEVATLKWNGVMFSTMDVVGRDLQPQLNATPSYALFFVLFIFISLFCWNLFIAVIIDHFNQESGSAFLTEGQKNWVEMKRLFLIIKPKKKLHVPTNKARLFFFKISRSKVFQYFMLAIVMLNVGFMASNYYVPEDQREVGSWYFSLEMINHGFLFIYLIEVIINLVGLGPKYFFHGGWYIFDFVTVMGSLVFGVLETITSMKAIVLVSRALRFMRIFRLVKYVQGLKILFQTLIISAPAILNVLGLLVIMYAVFACISMQLFGKVRYQVFLNRNANFRTFGVSMATLWQLASGDEWMGVMRDAMNSESYLPCTHVSDYPSLVASGHNPDESDCGDTISAPLFFIVFYILSVFVFLNLLVAVIMESFESVYTKEVSKLNESHLQGFREQWTEVDQSAKGYISSKLFIPFVTSLEEPLGFKAPKGNGSPRRVSAAMGEAHQMEYLVRMKSMLRNQDKRSLKSVKSGNLSKMPSISSLGEKYYMRDILEVLVLRALGHDSLTDEDRGRMEKLLRAIDGFHGSLEKRRARQELKAVSECDEEDFESDIVVKPPVRSTKIAPMPESLSTTRETDKNAQSVGSAVRANAAL